MKDKLLKVLFPNRWILCLLFNFIVISLTYIFLNNLESNLLSFIAYPIQTYGIIVIGLRIYLDIKQLIHFLDTKFIDSIHSHTSMYLSLTISLCMTLFELIVAFIYQVKWFYALAGYNLILSIMRAILVYRDVMNKKEAILEVRKIKEINSYQTCGWMMLLLNITISVMINLVVIYHHTIIYHEFVLYGLAAYTFYHIGIVAYHLIRYRKNHQLVTRGIKCIALAKGFVSIFTLQVAMIYQFGDSNQFVTQIANGATGLAVCTFINLIALYMIKDAKNQKGEVYGKQ